MTQECKRCARAANNAFLCRWCTDNLRTQLRELPWWIARLVESSLGQVKLGDGGQRYRRATEGLTRYADPDVGDDRLEEDLAKGKLELTKVLAQVNINARAADEHQKIRTTLAWWIKDLCTTRGIELPKLSQAGGMARWLATHASAVAAQENAANCCDDISSIVSSVERIVNRPAPPRYLGPCPVDPAPEELLTKRRDKGDHTTRCNYALTAKLEAKDAQCPQCDTDHDIKELLDRQMEELEDKSFTMHELTRVILPARGEEISVRTIQHWIKYGHLMPTGYAGEDPRYRYGDIRTLHSNRAQKAATGAKAHKKRAS